MRAKNNKKYYEEMIAEEEKKKHESAGGDTGEVETDVFKNKRQLDEYRRSSDFSAYEALCRGEETHVSCSMPWLNICFLLLFKD